MKALIDLMDSPLWNHSTFWLEYSSSSSHLNWTPRPQRTVSSQRPKVNLRAYKINILLYNN